MVKLEGLHTILLTAAPHPRDNTMAMTDARAAQDEPGRSCQENDPRHDDLQYLGWTGLHFSHGTVVLSVVLQLRVFHAQKL